MVKYTGDKAKKEFAIDNQIELNLIRNKYTEELTTEDDKKILPAFFGHVARLKGYYDPQHKAYVQHDTSMDYIQRIVRRFRTKNKLPEPTSLLSDIFGGKRYYERNVDKKMVSHIMKAVIKYSCAMQNLYNVQYCVSDADKSESYEERHAQKELLYQELADTVGQFRIGYSTMIFLIKSLEHKDKRKYRNILLPLLLTVCRESFIEAVRKTEDAVSTLVEGGEDVFLYDIGLKITKNVPSTHID